MTKKHFKMLEAIMQRHYFECSLEGKREYESLVNDICYAFKQVNPLFDDLVFKEAIFK